QEVWEISYLDDPPAVFNSFVHDYRMGEGLAEQGRFPVRRIQLDDYLDDFFFDQSYHHLIGASRSDRKGQVVNLLVGRKIATIDLNGMPHLGSGISWTYQGRTVMASPNLKDGTVSIIDMETWQVIKKLDTLGPGFFMRSHEASPYAWVDVFFGPDRDAVHIIDKSSLEIVKTLRPVPGKTSAHVEFTRDGRYALLSIWDNDGAVIVYDGDTLEEVKRIPMNKPVGKYNVYNKITRSQGTSH
ncbi:MAG: cytochrome C oxidase Cbb3, partial [Gammaproteobacteria bacterium]|nr:cytochrome C oxidase Cbb3 [Gammaproteobacteria bacterium]